MIRAILIATALAVLVGFLVRLSPLGERESSEPGVQGQLPADDNVAAGQEPESADGVANSRPSPAPVADRDVTPDGFTRGRPPGAAFARLPPRPSLSTPPVEADAASRSTRQVLLPRPVATDATHLKIGAGTIVLTGIAPLPLDKTCGTGAGAWPCGMRARTALRGYLRSRSVRCEVPEDFGQARETIESACTLRGDDIGEWIVRNGWAEARAGGAYEEAEAEARRKRRGIWR
ncbi:MAG TPA: hypothetical protein VIN77_04630 [Aurantimonas sp.]